MSNKQKLNESIKNIEWKILFSITDSNCLFFFEWLEAWFWLYFIAYIWLHFLFIYGRLNFFIYILFTGFIHPWKSWKSWEHFRWYLSLNLIIKNCKGNKPFYESLHVGYERGQRRVLDWKTTPRIQDKTMVSIHWNFNTHCLEKN